MKIRNILHELNIDVFTLLELNSLTYQNISNTKSLDSTGYLESDISSIEGDLSDIESAVSDAERSDNLDVIYNHLSSVDSDVNRIESTIKNLRDNINKVEEIFSIYEDFIIDMLDENVSIVEDYSTNHKVLEMIKPLQRKQKIKKLDL